MTADRFKEIIVPHYGIMYAVAVKIMRDRRNAEDAVQETVVKLWDNRDALVDVANFEAFCVNAVKHQCIDMLRNFNFRIEASASDLATADSASAYDMHRADSRSDLQMVNRLMSRLSDDQQHVIKLSAYGGLSNTEIASATGLSNDNVRTLLSRARRRLRDMFQQMNGNH